MADEAAEASSESTKKPVKAKTETVVNCNKAGGHITDMAGVKCPVGSLVKLPPEVCERLVQSGVARYPAKAES